MQTKACVALGADQVQGVESIVSAAAKAGLHACGRDAFA